MTWATLQWNSRYVDDQLLHTLLGVGRACALRNGFQRADADDIAHEAVLQEIPKLCAGKIVPEKACAWCRRAVGHICADRRRAAVTEKRLLEQFGYACVRTSAQPLWPAEAVERAELLSLLSSALRALEAKDRAVLELRYIEALSSRAIAHRMKTTAGAVAARAYRARKKLAHFCHQLAAGTP